MPNDIPGADVLGLGFDIFSGKPSASHNNRIVLLPEGGSKQLTYAGETYSVPNGVSVIPGDGKPTLTSTAFVGESAFEIQNHFALEAHINGTYGGFTGKADVMFGMDSTSSQSSWYGIIEGSYNAFSISIDGIGPSADFLTSEEVKQMLTNLKFNSASPDDFFEVFRHYGTHYINGVTLGASVSYAATVDRSAATSKLDVTTKLGLEYKAVSTDTAAAEIDADWSSAGESWAKSRRIQITAIGGQSKLLNDLDPSYGEGYESSFKDWLNAVDQSPDIVSYDLKSLSSLFDGSFADEVEKAVAAYTSHGIYVESLISGSTYSGLIEVSGCVAPRLMTEKVSGGAQLVVIDANSEKIVINRTVFGCDGSADELWNSLLPRSTLPDKYYPVLSVFAWYSNYYPSAEFATWLESCGASLQCWRDVQASDPKMLTYTFIGESGITPGSGMECIDWDRGQQIAKSALGTALIPKVGGGFDIGLGVSNDK